MLGLWDVAAKAPGTEHVTISVSGARGGETVDFRKLAHGGITLLGRASDYQDGKVLVDGDLVENIAAGDANYFDMLKQADAYIDRFGLDLPEEPEAHVLVDDPECLTHPLRELDLAAANVTNVIWATGYTQDFSWIDLPNACDANGAPYLSAVFHRNPGSIFWACRGNRGAGPRLSGVFGTTHRMSQIR